MGQRASFLARSGVTLACLLVLVAAVPPASHGQGAGSATLRGTVVDPSGGVLPGAALTLNAVRTRTIRSATTGAEGGFVFAALTPGPYRLRAELDGFGPWESDVVHLSPGDTVALDVSLEIGARTDEVTVTAEREMMRQDTGAREGLITAEQIQDLSIISRSALELLRILPGTTVHDDQGALETVSFGLGAGDYTVNGVRGVNNTPVLDGANVLDRGNNGAVMLTLNPDMVDEVKVQSANYAAQYGSSAVQISAVTKSGSSSFHGSGYDHWRNWRLAANDRSNNYAGIPKPKSDYHYPGFNLSGPVLIPGTDFNRERDTLFFFVGYEYQHQVVDQGTTLAVVPTPAQRQGDFSELLAGVGQNLGQPQIVTIPAGFPGAGQPAPGNDLSPYLDPFGQAYANIYPQPNYSAPNNRHNYAFSDPLPQNRWQLTSRLDWNVSPSTRAYLRLTLENERVESRRGLWNSGGYELPTRSISDSDAWSVAASVTSVLSPSLTNEVVVTASRVAHDNRWEDPSRVSFAALGLEGFEGIFPPETDEAPIQISADGQNLGAMSPLQGLPIPFTRTSVTLMDNLTKVLSAHTLRMGVFVERYSGEQGEQSYLGRIGLGSTWTPGGTGNDFGDLIVGRMASYWQATPAPTAQYRFWAFEGYAQDSWKVRRNLTLEAGLRVSKMKNNEEVSGLALRFEPSAYDPNQGPFIDGDPERPNGMLLERRGEIPRGMTDEPGVAFMPRFSFAWDIRGGGDVTLRGGAGLFYNRASYNQQNLILYTVPNAQLVVVNWWDVPELTLQSLRTIDPMSHLGVTDFNSLDARSVHVPRTWTWSLAAAKRLPWSQTLEVAYVGHDARHLPNRTWANYIPPGTLTGSYGNADLDNPLHRAALDGSVVAASRLYPAYGGGPWWYQYEAESTYHGLQATLSRQGAGRVQYFVNYSFGKTLGTTGAWDSAVIDPIDPARSYGRVPQDRTHIFNASYNVVLPGPIAPDGNGLLRGLLNGWQVSGITSYRSGWPLRIVFDGELSMEAMALAWWGTDAHRWGEENGRAGSITPVFLGDPRTGNTAVGESIVDVDQIGIPALGETGPIQQPYYLRMPSRWNWDLTLMKNFPLGGEKRLQLRLGVFNLFNQASPLWFAGDIDFFLQTDCNVRVDGVPNGAGGYANGVCDPSQGFHFTELSRENYGKIRSKHGHRVIELAVRFDF